MKLCLVTNYINKGYVNELLIFNKLCSTLNLLPCDIYSFENFNSSYKINKKYTHALILLDYKVSTLSFYKEYLEELKIPKLFIIDTIPHHHEKLQNKLNPYHKSSPFTCLPLKQQKSLYEDYADGVIFYSNIDKDLFDTYYIFKKPNVPFAIIPPSLGNIENIKFKRENLKPNNLIGFNGSPSHSNGFIALDNLLINPNTYTLNIYGTHGREEIVEENIMNYLTNNHKNINFKGKLKNLKTFYNNHHIYYGASIYDSFNYFLFLSTINGMVPILSHKTGTASYFKHYPFISDNSSESIKYNIDLIINSPIDYLRNILESTVENFKELNDESLKNKYYSFINEF